MEEYTWWQWCYYHRYNIQNGLLALVVFGQFVFLIYKIYRGETRKNELDQPNYINDNASFRRNRNRFSLFLKGRKLNCRECYNRNARKRTGNGVTRDNEC